MRALPACAGVSRPPVFGVWSGRRCLERINVKFLDFEQARKLIDREGLTTMTGRAAPSSIQRFASSPIAGWRLPDCCVNSIWIWIRQQRRSARHPYVRLRGEMPRKQRTMKAQRVDVADQLFHYLTFRDWDAAAALAKPEDSVWLLFGGVGKYSHELAWEAISDESVDLWIEEHPGSRAASWWYWSSPELRQVFGGSRH